MVNSTVRFPRGERLSVCLPEAVNAPSLQQKTRRRAIDGASDVGPKRDKAASPCRSPNRVGSERPVAGFVASGQPPGPRKNVDDQNDAVWGENNEGS